MSEFLKDTPCKLATCPRCKAYVLAAQQGGLKVAADMAPLSMDEYRAALIAGRPTYDLLEQGGRPHKLRARTLSTPPGTHKILAGHGCGAHGMDAVQFEEVVQGPPQAPVTRGGNEGGLHPQRVPAGAQGSSSAPQGTRWRTAPRSPATPANPRRSRNERQWLYRRCENCGEQMGYEKAYGVMIGDMWKYVWHDPCPKDVNGEH
jgi:hypothetical protein